MFLPAGNEARKDTINKYNNIAMKFPFKKAREDMIYKSPSINIYTALKEKYKDVFYHFGDADIVKAKNLKSKSTFNEFEDLKKVHPKLIRAGGNYHFDEDDIDNYINDKIVHENNKESSLSKLKGKEAEIQLLKALTIEGNKLDMQSRIIWDGAYRDNFMPPAWYSEANTFLRGSFIHTREVKDEYLRQLKDTKFPDINIPLYHTLKGLKREKLSEFVTYMGEELSLATSARNDIRDRDRESLIDILSLKNESEEEEKKIILALARFPLVHYLHNNTNKPNNNQFRLMAMNQMFELSNNTSGYKSLRNINEPLYKDIIRAKEIYPDLYSIIESNNNYDYNYNQHHQNMENEVEKSKNLLFKNEHITNTSLSDTLGALNQLAKQYKVKVQAAYKAYRRTKNSAT